MNTAIITAAGSGKRLPGQVKKQFINLEGRPILLRTLDVFVQHAEVDRIIVTLPAEDLEPGKEMIACAYPNQEIRCISGGMERQQSVYLALEECDAETDYVLVHDGVRPFVKSEDISALLHLAYDKKAVIPVSPVNHTLKMIQEGKVLSTVPREDIYLVHTPQVFAYRLLLDSYRQIADVTQIFTDDASVLEYLDIPVYSLVVSPWNIKITTPEDIRIAESIIAKGDKE